MIEKILVVIGVIAFILMMIGLLRCIWLMLKIDQEQEENWPWSNEYKHRK